MFVACLLVFIIDFMIAGQEILWVKLFNISNCPLPRAIYLVLTMYLIGILIGRLSGRRIAQRGGNVWVICAYALLAASVLGFIAPWLFMSLAQLPIQTVVGGSFVMMMAGLQGVIFPIANHRITPSNAPKLTPQLTPVFFANYIGLVSGAAITGLFLIHYLSLPNCFTLYAALTGLVSMFCFRKELRPATVILGSIFAVVVGSFIGIHYAQINARRQLLATEVHYPVKRPPAMVGIYPPKKPQVAPPTQSGGLTGDLTNRILQNQA